MCESQSGIGRGLEKWVMVMVRLREVGEVWSGLFSGKHAFGTNILFIWNNSFKFKNQVCTVESN